MSTPTFAKTNNLITYLKKPTEGKGFEQIIDFLNGSSVSYALTASLTICTSCIKQFWTTAKVKTINDEVRIQALIDENRVNIKESSIRRTLKLDDAEGTSCLADAENFDGLAKMGYEKLSEKITFYKAFFLPEWKFLIHTILQVDKLEEENRVLKDLYSQTQAPKVPSPEPSSKHRLPSFSNDPLPGEPAEVEEVLEVVKAAKLMTEVVTTAGATTTVEATKVNVPRRRRGGVIQDPKETTSTVVMHSEVQSKDRGKGILIEEHKSLKGKSQIEQDEAFARQLEAELNVDINWTVVMEQVKRSERLNDAVMKCQALKRKPLTKAQAWKNMIIYLKNMDGFKMNYFKGMTYSEIRPLFKKHYNYNQDFLEEVNEEVTVPDKEVEVEDHKRKGKSLEKVITKKQKIDEEAEKLKSHLQIVSNDDDDVYTEATPLETNIPIVDYKIHFERNKPYFKIIREDEPTMKEYMMRTREDYGSSVARLKFDKDAKFELKGQFLKDLHEHTFSGLKNEDTNEHIERVLEIVYLFTTPNVTPYQLMLCVFPITLIGTASRWLRNENASSITTWKYFLFYKGLDVPTRQIFDSKGDVPKMSVADAKKAIE
nr:hypothetical protein [Tanacetum cinerariifolium]